MDPSLEVVLLDENKGYAKQVIARCMELGIERGTQILSISGLNDKKNCIHHSAITKKSVTAPSNTEVAADCRVSDWKPTQYE